MEIRQLSRNFLTKIILLLVVIALVFWGVGSVPGSDNYVAKIDNKNYIYTDTFNHYKKNFVHSISTMDPNLSLDSLNIDSFVLNSMIHNKLLELEYKKLGLLVSDNAAIDEIKKNKSFFDKEGKFDKSFFQRVIVNYGFTEKEYIQSIKRAIANQMFESAIVPLSPSESIVNSLYQYDNQTRIVRIVTIKPSKHNTYIPTEDDIKKYYDSHQSEFLESEKRDVEFLIISPKHFLKHRKEQIETNANHVQLAEKEMHNAIKDIEDDISSGESLKTIGKKYNLHYFTEESVDKNNNSTLKTIKKDEAEKFISTIFDIADESSPSDTVQLSPNSNDYYIVNTIKIYPSKLLSLDEKVKKNIMKTLKEQDYKTLVRKRAIGIYQQFIKHPKDLSEILKSHKESIEESIITVSRTKNRINPEIADSVFNLKTRGDYTNIIQNKKGDYVFAILHKIILPSAQNLSKEEREKLQNTLLELVTTETNNELMHYLYNSHRIEIKAKNNIIPQQ